MTLSQAAKYAGVAPNTLRHAVATKKLTAKRVGSLWITTKAAVDDWQRQRTMGRPPKKK
jgi:excisionase family DNA binding protein